jgi:hypothetical protein
MKMLLALIACLFMVVASSAQEKASVTRVEPVASSTEKLLETHIRKVWEDYKNKDKQGLGSALADGFREVTDGADGIFGKDTEFSEMEKFTLAHYELSNFHVKPIGKDATLVTYTAHYDGAYEGTPLQMSTVYGEVWIKQGNAWKLLWAQETKVK